MAIWVMCVRSLAQTYVSINRMLERLNIVGVLLLLPLGFLTINQGYHRSMLIFSPEKDFFDVGDIAEFACTTLSNVNSTKPSHKERKLVRRLTESCSSGKIKNAEMKRAVAVLTDVAMRWKDIDAWIKAVSLCPESLKLLILGDQDFVNACSVFGFIPLEPQFVKFLPHFYLQSFFFHSF